MEAGRPLHSNLPPTIPTRAWTSRYYAGAPDFEQMQALLIEARARTDDWRYAHVGELMFAYFMLVCHLDPCRHIRLWHNADGGLVGYAILGEDPVIDWQVLPDYEWLGIEAEALIWAEERLGELRRGAAAQWSGRLASGARQDNPLRIAFLEQHGFRYRGEFAEVNLLRALDGPIPAPALPAGFQVRAVAAVGEVSRRAAAQRDVWQPWTVGNVSDDNYAAFMQMPGYHRELDIVTVTPQGVIAAYANGWIDPLNRIGDFGPVGALPAYRRQGLTRAALLEGLRRMQALGMQRVCISTGIRNTPARRLYESIGFKSVNQYLDYEKYE